MRHNFLLIKLFIRIIHLMHLEPFIKKFQTSIAESFKRMCVINSRDLAHVSIKLFNINQIRIYNPLCIFKLIYSLY